MSVRVVKQWNVEDTEPPVAISRDGQLALVATGMNNSIDCLGVPAGKKVHGLDGHSSSVKALAIAPDRRRGASGAEDGEIRLWDLASGKLISALRGHSERYVR
jgi:WD40 repeat protein